MKPLLKRIEALEKEATTRAVIWIDPPENGLAGWQIVPMSKGGSADIWREDDESDEALEARASAAANRHRGVVVAFGMDAQGGTR
ncbi:hypothetical protein [Vreelandella olivaria]|uniref:hypothetical protein n=1 Tax=Vreelandella olivaria TaxID=390919 RepID=UPI00201ECCB8|nr:hypothetical protein [Halomonas olivaria]